MKHYDSIDNIKYNTELLGEQVWAFNKLDGQNFCAKYSVKKKMFTNFGSRKCMVDESSEQFGDAVRYFKSHNYENILSNIVEQHRGKKDVFSGVDEITFFFEWYGEHSFAGFHSLEDKDNMHLALIDVFIKRKDILNQKFIWIYLKIVVLNYLNQFIQGHQLMTLLKIYKIMIGLNLIVNIHI